MLCLMILVVVILSREHALEVMLAAKLHVISICLVAVPARLWFSRGGLLVSLACGTVIATGSFFAILFYATSTI